MAKSSPYPQVPDRTYFVNQNFTDNERTHHFSTIQGAIDFAYSQWGAITDFSYSVTILVYPGRYEEQIHSHLGYHIQGFSHEAAPARKTAVIYNTGADAEHYPLRGDDGDNYYIEGMNVEVEYGGTIGKLADDYFTKVFFKYGSFIEPTMIDNTYSQFKDCAFHQAGFNFKGAQVTGRHTIQMWDCWLNKYAWVTSSTHNDTCSFYIDNCIFNNSTPNVKGDWNMQMINSHVFGDTRTTINTTSDITIVNSILSNGLHFKSDPSTVKIESCCYIDNEGYPITGADITADVDVTLVSYIDNIQQNGICGCIHHTSPTKNFGGDSTNRYFTLQDAVDSITTQGTVIIYEDITAQPELVLGAGIQVSFDAQRIYSLAFAADVVNIPNDAKCGFVKFASLNGGAITLNGSAAEVSFEDNQYIVANLVLTRGAFAIIYKSSFFGSTGKPAIQIDSYDTPMIVGYSRIQGSTGNGAVVFSVDADDTFKAKYSTFIHGDKGSNSPFIGDSINDVTISMYNCGLNAVFPPPNFTNNIGSPNNTVDPNITF